MDAHARAVVKAFMRPLYLKAATIVPTPPIAATIGLDETQGTYSCTKFWDELHEWYYRISDSKVAMRFA